LADRPHVHVSRLDPGATEPMVTRHETALQARLYVARGSGLEEWQILDGGLTEDLIDDRGTVWRSRACDGSACPQTRTAATRSLAVASVRSPAP
jgi:hypothetical protein